jgi:hypothetical protein
MALTPRASVAWQHAFGDVNPAAALAFQSTGAAFSVAGVPVARDAAQVEAGSASPISASSPAARRRTRSKAASLGIFEPGIFEPGIFEPGISEHAIASRSPLIASSRRSSQ